MNPVEFILTILPSKNSSVVQWTLKYNRILIWLTVIEALLSSTSSGRPYNLTYGLCVFLTKNIASSLLVLIIQIRKTA